MVSFTVYTESGIYTGFIEIMAATTILAGGKFSRADIRSVVKVPTPITL